MEMINIIASCCIKNDNKVLLVQENKRDIEGLWNLPGGKVKEDENVIKAAKREILEETGYNVKIDSILLIQNYINSIGELLIIYFNASLVDSEQQDYREKEIKNVQWMTVDEMKKIPDDKIRGGAGMRKIISNIENGVEYPLDLIDIYE